MPNVNSSEAVRALVSDLGLSPHPEGGFYRETYRSSESVAHAGLPERFTGDRSLATAIYFLLGPGDFSAFHRILSDETWHYYSGSSPLAIHVIHEDGRYQLIRLGAQTAAGETFQETVPARAWFASEPLDPSGYALVGCTVAPGFDFRDFEMGDGSQLASIFPHLSELVQRLSR